MAINQPCYEQLGRITSCHMGLWRKDSWRWWTGCSKLSWIWKQRYCEINKQLDTCVFHGCRRYPSEPPNVTIIIRSRFPSFLKQVPKVSGFWTPDRMQLQRKVWEEEKEKFITLFPVLLFFISYISDMISDPSVLSFDILPIDLRVPVQKTYYHCQLFKLPELSTKHHIIEVNIFYISEQDISTITVLFTGKLIACDKSHSL